MKITRDHVKQVSAAVVGTSVTSVVKTIIKANYAPTNQFQEAKLFVTCFALGGLIASAATDHTNSKVDKLADKIAEVKHKIDNPETTS